MKNIILAISILMFLPVLTAQAHTPIRQSSIFSIEINENAEKVWAIIQDFTDMSWHPMVANIDKTHGGNQKGATRTLTLKSGGQLTQEIKKYNAQKKILKFKTPTEKISIIAMINFKGQDYPIRALPVGNLLDQLKVESLGDNKTKLVWKAAYIRAYMNSLAAGELPELNDDAANNAVQKYVKAGMLGILKKFNQNATEAAISCLYFNSQGKATC